MPNCVPFTITLRFWKYAPLAWTLTLETVTPSAEDAVKAYELIFWPVTPAEITALPKALFTEGTKLELESDKALPVAPDELADALEIKPNKLLPVS